MVMVRKQRTQMVFFGITIIYMGKFMIIGQGRILLDQPEQQQSRLSLKICVGTNISKYPNLHRNIQCDRWETPQIKLNYLPELPIELELYYPSKSIPKVVGEAIIESHLVSSPPQEEFKIALTYDGMIKGWFYCFLNQEGTNKFQVNQKYLYIHKVNLFFRDDYEKEFTLTIFQNETPIFSKQFKPIPNSKTLFPNFRNAIRFSDVIKITLTSDGQYFTPISFLVDKIKRGKTAYFDSWIRNKHHNKIGDIRLQYFLDNSFLDNERKVLSRKPIYPHALSRASSSLKSQNIQIIEAELERQMGNSPEKTRPQTILSIGEESLKDEDEKENYNQEKKDLSTCHNSSTVFSGRSKQLLRAIYSPKVNDNAIPCLKKKTLIKVCRKDPSQFYLDCPIQ